MIKNIKIAHCGVCPFARSTSLKMFYCNLLYRVYKDGDYEKVIIKHNRIHKDCPMRMNPLTLKLK